MTVSIEPDFFWRLDQKLNVKSSHNSRKFRFILCSEDQGVNLDGGLGWQIAMVTINKGGRLSHNISVPKLYRNQYVIIYRCVSTRLVAPPPPIPSQIPPHYLLTGDPPLYDDDYSNSEEYADIFREGGGVPGSVPVAVLETIFLSKVHERSISALIIF